MLEFGDDVALKTAKGYPASCFSSHRPNHSFLSDVQIYAKLVIFLISKLTILFGLEKCIHKTCRNDSQLISSSGDD